MNDYKITVPVNDCYDMNEEREYFQDMLDRHNITSVVETGIGDLVISLQSSSDMDVTKSVLDTNSYQYE
jgi:hypothetical protein